MANSVTSGNRYEYATVNTAPTTAGYYTNPVNAGQQRVERLCFTVRGTGSMIVTLQFICPGDAAWNDYATYNAPAYTVIEGDGAGVRWRAGVKSADDYVEGTLKFGFNW